MDRFGYIENKRQSPKRLSFAFNGIRIVKVILCFLFVINCNTNILKGQNHILSFSCGTSFDITNFNWSIAGNEQGENPNILSELKFKKIISIGSFLAGDVCLLRKIHLTFFYSKEGITGGNGTDKDYRGDNRSNIIYDESFNSNKGSSQMFEFGTGYNIVEFKKAILGLGVNYCKKYQNFYILNSSYENLNSTYGTQWNDWKIYLSGYIYPSVRVYFKGLMGYTLLKYNAIANWNLIDEFSHPVSFRDKAKGKEIECTLSAGYIFNTKTTFFLNSSFVRHDVGKGKDILFLKNASQISTQFNGAIMKNAIFTFGVQYSL